MARILIVDDDEMERLLGRTILEGVGHELHFAKDGADAMRIFRTEDIDVVVTDLNMPRIAGLRLIREIREFDDRVPVVVVSGIEPSQLDLAHDLGAVETLFKPVDPQKLIDAVAKAVERYRRDEEWV